MKTKKKFKVEISVISPCYNEEDNVKMCAEQFKHVMKKNLPGISYEHIFVDNNSQDLTFKIISEMAKKDKRIKVVKNSRNVGSFYNMWVGMEHCSGKYIVPLLPADLQDPPAQIPKMYQTLIKTNSLVVYGVIEKREENFFMRKTREFYYYLVNKLSDSKLPQNSGEFLIADSRVVQSVLGTKDNNPYIRGLFAQANVKSVPLPYTKIKRKYGKSKETPLTLVNAAINGFISTSTLLPRVILFFGLTASITSVLMAFFNFTTFLFNGTLGTQSGIPTLLISMFFFNGVQLLFLGLATEYIQAIYKQVRPIPKAFVTDKINF